mmetsp:Transcript_13350/g.40471  ORF Transcript_13350/g.40471 Transcript_13350/m.40471 type:complete len:286 (+) Transcript_13350:43-900(+)|eukprot:scaffold55563_cov39-Tisochrysis_lutea.AAC.1
MLPGSSSAALGLATELARRQLERVFGVYRPLLILIAIMLVFTASRRRSAEEQVEEEVDGAFSSPVAQVEASWGALLARGGSSAGEFPVDALLHAMAVQSRASRVIGTFMVLVCKCDEANMRSIRSAWELHGRPKTLRELAQREKLEGVQMAPGKLKESAALALLWSTRMLGFWLGILRVLADAGPGGQVNMPHHATEVVYAHWVEPFHSFLLRSTFRASLRALPAREDMLVRLAGGRARRKGPPTADDIAALVADCKRCVETTTRVIANLRATLDEIGLQDTQKV